MQKWYSDSGNSLCTQKTGKGGKQYNMQALTNKVIKSNLSLTHSHRGSVEKLNSNKKGFKKLF